MYIIYICYLCTSESILKQSKEYAAIITLYNGSIYTHNPGLCTLHNYRNPLIYFSCTITLPIYTA